MKQGSYAVPVLILVLLSITSNALAVVDSQLQQRIHEAVDHLDGQRIIAGEKNPADWLNHGRTYSAKRYSPLDQINSGNVEDLDLAWYLDLGTKRGLEGTPIVVDGIMYATGSWGVVFAIDARNGELIWQNDLDVDKSRGLFACCDVVSRGPAVWKGKVYTGTTDGRLVALDAATGEIIWDTLTIDLKRPYTITGAPRVVKDKVLIGNGGAEYGVRGYISAYDSETGDLAWRFYTVPGNPEKGFENEAMEMAAQTWGGGPWWEVGGGGTVWDSMAYDPELDLLYFGVGNGSPWNKYIRSPAGGDNLFLSSIVAVRPDTGQYVWHYQTTPGEAWDYTATQNMILAELEIDNKPRKIIMQAPKNGFFYILDRASGELLSAENYVPVNWATHVDMETGKPVQTKNDYNKRPTLQFPSPLGGHNWQPMCYHPKTGYVYIPSREMSMLYNNDKSFEYEPGYWNVGLKVMKDIEIPTWIGAGAVAKLGGASAKGFVQAWDPVKQRRMWKINLSGAWNGGTLCSGDNLFFQGNADGKLVAYAADSGKKLWSYFVQHGIIAPPITYMVDGEQYVTVMAGWGGSGGLSFSPVTNAMENMYPEGRVLTFKLNGTAQLPPWEGQERKLPEPPPLTASDKKLLKKGNRLYHHHCVYCHGPAAMTNPVLSDLRYMDAETHEQFIPIVMGGIQGQENGMIGFADKMTIEEAEAIHAYLIKLGQDTLKAEEAPAWWKGLKNSIYSVLAVITGWVVSLMTWIMNRG